MFIETTVDGQQIRGHLVVLYPRILAVEMLAPFRSMAHEYGERISPADAKQGIVYSDGHGQITERGKAEAEAALARLYLRERARSH